MDNREAALVAAMDAYVEARMKTEREAWRESGIQDAFQCLLAEALRELEANAPVGRAHYEMFKPALDHLRSVWPQLRKK